MTLGRADITRVLKSRQKDLARCVQDKALKGRLISVSVRILRNGRVQRARILTSWMRGKKEAGCIESQVRSYTFPAFRGDPMAIPLPIRP